MISPLSHRFVQAKWGGFHLKDLFEIKSSIKRFDANKVTVFREFPAVSYSRRQEAR